MINNERIKIFYEMKIKVHISCTDNKFYNGFILEINNSKKFLILNDNKLGSLPVMFEDIISIEPYVEVKE